MSAQWIDQANPTDLDLKDAFFINENTGWMCGRYNDIFVSGPIAKTTNGGNNWTLNNTNFSGVTYGLHFFDANTGIVTGRYTFRTTNGGNNWTQLTMAIGAFNTSIYFVNNLTGWVCGFFGTIQKTTNGGNNWVQQSQGLTAETFQHVYFINSSTGWFTGDAGGILKTTDGGSSWQLQNVGAAVTLEQIRFTDANTGIVCGDNNYRTTNGGQNWTAIADLSGKENNCLKFINSLTGWTAGDDGIFFTSNGGVSWIEQNNGSGSGWFESIAAFSSGTVYAVGQTIRKSTTGGFNLSVPTNLTLTPVSTSQINLTWDDNSSDEEKFIIERSSDGNNWSIIDSVNAGATSYQNTGLSADQLYYYRVYGKKIIFTSGYSATEWTRTPMTAPALSSPEAGTVIPFVPILQWTTAPNALTYTLQVASDTNFTNIVYTITAPGLTSIPVPPANLQNSTRYYWRARVSSFSNQSLFTPYRDFIFRNPNYGNNMSSGNALYYYANSTSGADLSPSKPTYNWRDTSGSIYLVKNGAFLGSIYAGNIDDGLFRLNSVLTGSDAVRFFGNNYQTIYIGTNGVVSFSPYDPLLGINIEPPTGGLASTNINNAILPLWKDINFNDGDVSGRTLCYKVTSSEIIISYLKAPSYNTAVDANDYVSFQVIIQHSVSPAGNSKINYMYNYDQTGSTFITKYNDNTILPMLVGIKGNSGQEFQYRFFNSSLQLINSGPIFSSNLALELGPNASLLPVELSTFTSSVNGSNVKLHWSTVNEQNNSGFEIQRTNANENNWKKISFIQGNGTTNENKNYSYEDRNIVSGKYQYRLKQIDFNGNYEYHSLANEVEIGVPKKFNLSQNYPNPFNPSTKINYELPITNYVSIKVFDLTGKEIALLVNENKKAGYYTVEFNGSNLASGTYFYHIQAGDFSAVKKMLLIK
ncbi:MAG: T9SS type A sorting domain-containing protein [Ignavibacteria bacterium]|nr:T9SS type A sorting domain-containing protein [Ignavibacteria bacterium]